MHFQEVEVTTATKKPKTSATKFPNKAPNSKANHLVEHSYSKTVSFEPEVQLVEEELAAEDVVEGSFIPHSTVPGMEPGQSGHGEQDLPQVRANTELL